MALTALNRKNSHVSVRQPEFLAAVTPYKRKNCGVNDVEAEK